MNKNEIGDNQTKEILKNYSQINQNILIKQGNQLKTVSFMKNIVVSDNCCQMSFLKRYL